MKDCTIYYVFTSAASLDISKVAGIGWLEGKGPRMGEMHFPFLTSLCLFLLNCMPLQTRWINRFALSKAQTTRFKPLRMCFLRVTCNTKLILRVENLQKPLPIYPLAPNTEFPAKSHSNNFWMVKVKRKIWTDQLYKIGVGESNEDVGFALAYPLAADFECPP
jgi:hypothetical protein